MSTFYVRELPASIYKKLPEPGHRRHRSITFSLLILLFFMVLPLGAQDIYQAIRQGDIEQIKAILKDNPKLVNAADHRDYTLLHYAALSGHIDIIELLLSMGADLEAKNNSGKTPIFYPIPFNKVNAFKHLSRRGANINIRDNNGETPLHWALSWKRPEIVGFLVDQDVQVNAAGKEGTKLLHDAAGGGHEKLVKLLIKKGTVIDLAPYRGRTLLHRAAFGGLTDLASMLIAKRAKVNERDCYGLTPLHIAASQGHTPVVDLLISKGANIDMKSNDGAAPLHLALKNNHTEAVELLTSKGADQKPRQFPKLSGAYLGQKPPGDTAVLFAPGIVSTPDSENAGTFSTTGSEYIFGRGPLGSRGITLYFMKQEKGRWTAPQPLPFSYPGSEGEPCFSPEGKQLFFISNRPLQEKGPVKRDLDIWVVERSAAGWGIPQNLGPIINSDTHEFNPTVTNKGTLYFHRSGIYRSLPKCGAYAEPEKVTIPGFPGPGHPYIAPDESYLLFDASPKGTSTDDIFITFHKRDGSWTIPINLGKKINTPGDEFCASVSPDQKYLFFTRDHDIYWADAGFINRLKAIALKE